MKFKFIIILLMLIISSMSVFSLQDEVNLETSQNTFLITEDTIQVQQDETQLERQLLSKEAEYLLKREIKQTYINEVWATYSSTIILFVDIIVMMFSLFIMRLLIFLTLEAIPLGINKLVDYMERWFV